MIETLPVLQSDAMNAHFEETGYEYSDFTLNMGPVLVIMLALPMLVIILLVTKCVCCCERVENFAKK